MSEDLKIYNVYIKYIEMTMDDGDILTYEAYSPFPKGHKVEAQLVKLSLKDAMNKINAMNDNDGLRLDYHGSTAYAPSTIKKVKWAGDDDVAKGRYLIDISESKETYKPGDIVTVGKQGYQCAKVIDWTRGFSTKFLYCTKHVEVVKPDVEKAIEKIKESENKQE